MDQPWVIQGDLVYRLCNVGCWTLETRVGPCHSRTHSEILVPAHCLLQWLHSPGPCALTCPDPPPAGPVLSRHHSDWDVVWVQDSIQRSHGGKWLACLAGWSDSCFL